MILRGNRQISAYLGLSRAQVGLVVEAGQIRRWFDDRGRACIEQADADEWLASRSSAGGGALTAPPRDGFARWENEGGAVHD